MSNEWWQGGRDWVRQECRAWELWAGRGRRSPEDEDVELVGNGYEDDYDCWEWLYANSLLWVKVLWLSAGGTPGQVRAPRQGTTPPMVVASWVLIVVMLLLLPSGDIDIDIYVDIEFTYILQGISWQLSISNCSCGHKIIALNPFWLKKDLFRDESIIYSGKRNH